MSLNPFTADAAIAARYQAAASSHGAAVTDAILAQLAARKNQPQTNLGSVLLRAEAEALVARFGLAGVEDLMLLALPAAQTIAAPPISSFFVGSVGLEAGTGNLIFGGNVEFPHTHLGTTIHGEGFVFTRAFSRGTSIAVIAIGEAHPCAHCRQYLSEFAATRDLLLIDPLGHRLTMGQLYPWPFDPDYLGDPGARPEATPWPNLAIADSRVPCDVTARLLTAGQRAHTPYSKCASAVVLVTSDGGLFAASAIESVAFNPSMGPLQAAFIDLLAHGYAYADVTDAYLATSIGGAVDYSASVTELLGKVAPAAKLTITAWSE